MTSPWTKKHPNYWQRNPEKAQQVIDLWMNGMTATDILHKIGAGREITRNAIIGKVHRAGLANIKNKRTPPPIMNPKAVLPPKPEKKIKIKPSEEPTQFGPVGMKDIPPEDLVTAVHLYNLKSHHCRWPTGDYLMFCGARMIPDARFSYCPEHYLRAVSTTKTKASSYARNYNSKYR